MRYYQVVFLMVDIFIRIQEKLKDLGDQHKNVQLCVSQSYSMSELVNQDKTVKGLLSLVLSPEVILFGTVLCPV